MTDAPLTIPKLREADLKRMKRIERAAFYKTRKDGLPAEYVNVEAIWLLHGGRCCCDQVRYPGCGGKPIDLDAPAGSPDALCLAHVEARRRRLGGGHTPENCRWWRYECNAAMAATENHDHGVGNKMAVDFARKLLAPDERRERGSSIKGRSEIKSRNDLAGRKGRGFDKTKTRGFDGKVRDRV